MKMARNPIMLSACVALLLILSLLLLTRSVIAADILASPAAGPAATMALDQHDDDDEVEIDVDKYVSGDGQQWRDADHPGDALAIPVGGDVYWRIEVENESPMSVTVGFSDTLDLNELPLGTPGFCEDLPDELGAGQEYVCEIGPGTSDGEAHVNRIVVVARNNGDEDRDSDRAYYYGGTGPNPDDDDEVEIEVHKYVSADGDNWEDALAIPVGDPVYWRIEVENESPMNVTVSFSDALDLDELPLGTPGFCEDLPDELDPDETYTCTIGPPAAPPAAAGPHVNRIVVVARNNGDEDRDGDRAYYYGGAAPTPDDDSTGCSQGYWKNHTLSWVGYDPDDDYATVFGVGASFTLSLLDTLRQGGGGEIALGRHAVAALLNAAHPDVDYAYTEAEVIALVQSAYASDRFGPVKEMLEEANEGECHLDGPNTNARDKRGPKLPKFWKGHPDNWPLEDLRIGRKWYSKLAALVLMINVDDDDDDDGDDVAAAASIENDMTYTLFSSTVAARLNVASGNEDDCIVDTLNAVDDWLTREPVGSGVSAGDPAWQTGAALNATLIDYNSGLLCAPLLQDATEFLFLPLISSSR